MFQNNILAIFDFCGTLVNFQTYSAFCDYVYARREKKPHLLNLFFNILIKTPVVRNRGFVKQLNLKRLKGISDDQFKHFCYSFVNILSMHNNSSVVKLLKRHIDNGHTVIILSAAIKDYIELWASNIDEKITVISNEILFNDSICTGKFKSFDVQGENKVRVLKNAVDLSKYNLFESYAYTDSLEDLPMLKLVEKKFIVKYDKIMQYN